jgi:predicted SnoaL-like aldol condensation-catalyzing enzyme
MSTQTNKLLMYRFTEALTNGDTAILDEFVSENFIEHSPDSPSGREGLKVFIRMIHAGFEKVQANVDNLIAEGNSVGGRVVITGKHVGSFLGIAPTGRELYSESLDIFRVEDGKLCEHWEVVNRKRLLESLGIDDLEDKS